MDLLFQDEGRAFYFQDQGRTFLFHIEVGEHPARMRIEPVDQAPAPTALEPEDEPA